MAFLISRPDGNTDFIIDYKKLDQTIWKELEKSPLTRVNNEVVSNDGEDSEADIICTGPLTGFTIHSDGHCKKQSLRILSKKIFSDYLENELEIADPSLLQEKIEERISSKDGVLVCEKILDSLVKIIPSREDRFYLSAKDYLTVLYKPEVFIREKLAVDSVDGKMAKKSALEAVLEGTLVDHLKVMEEQELVTGTAVIEATEKEIDDIAEKLMPPGKAEELNDWIESCYDTIPAFIKALTIFNPSLLKETFTPYVVETLRDLVTNDSSFIEKLDDLEEPPELESDETGQDYPDGRGMILGVSSRQQYSKWTDESPLNDPKIQEIASMLFILENSEDSSDRAIRSIIELCSEALAYCMSNYKHPTLAFLMVSGCLKLLRQYYIKIQQTQNEMEKAAALDTWTGVQLAIKETENRFGITWSTLKTTFCAARMIMNLYAQGSTPEDTSELLVMPLIDLDDEHKSIIKMFFPFVKMIADDSSFRRDTEKIKLYLKAISDKF